MGKCLKSITIIMLVLFTVSMVLSGCGKQADKQGDAAQSASTEQTKETVPQKPLEIAWSGPTNSMGNGVLIQEGTEIELELEKIFNVDIKPVQVDIYAPDALNTLIGSGTIPDCFLTDPSNFAKFIEQGVAREITKDMIIQNAPTIAKMMTEADGGAGWARSAYKGKLYGVASINYGNGVPFGAWYRLDWAENVGITKAPETIDELEVMLRKFTREDPDKNGKNDTYGLSGATEWEPEAWRWAEIFGAFGVFPKNWLLQDGKVVYGGIQPGYKEGLKFLHKLNKDGVIDPEFLTQKAVEYGQDLVNGVFGYDSPGYPYSDETTLDAFRKAGNKEAKVKFITKITGPEGKWMNWCAGKANGWVLVFGKDVPDEKVAKILQILERLVVDDETHKFAYAGKEGVHYDLVGEVPKAKPDFETAEARAKLGVGAGFYTYMFVTRSQMKYYFDEASLINMGKAIDEGNPVMNAVFTPLDANTKYGTQLNDIFNKFYYEAITGKIDIDAEWDAYVDNWMKSGGEELMKEANEAYAGYAK